MRVRIVDDYPDTADAVGELLRRAGLPLLTFYRARRPELS